MKYASLNVRIEDSICYAQIDRLAANNTINAQLIAECHALLDECEESAVVVVLSGHPTVFCFGADFDALHAESPQTESRGGPEALYDLWLRFATGPYVTISHVRGKANAGGIGFVAASDIVLADDTAQFSLSELLFGLYPACVLPFLRRRIGFQKANYLTLMTQPISAALAREWGLVDGVEPDSDGLLRRHLLRLRRLSKTAIRRYKTYANQLDSSLLDCRSDAIAGNREVFADADNLRSIARYRDLGLLPWEKA